VLSVCASADRVGVAQVLTPADDVHHINKHNFKVPFVCGCRDLGEALRRIAEGAAMIRTKARPFGDLVRGRGG
jgi:pyridoxal 5'-phosphate synthase pdxS subunit